MTAQVTASGAPFRARANKEPWYGFRFPDIVLPRFPLPSYGPFEDPNWSPDVAEERALELGLCLSPVHWQVLTYAREECLTTHRFPDACLITETTRIPRAELERLFPGRTCDVIARLAGLPPKTRRPTSR